MVGRSKPGCERTRAGAGGGPPLHSTHKSDREQRRATMAKFGIGQAVRRVEDQRFLLGQGRYVDDISLPGLCHGVTVLSPHAHARITRIDVAKAKAAPGVLCVLTGADAVAARRQLYRSSDAGRFRRTQGPPHLPACAQRQKGALRRRSGRLRRGRDARAGA